jgi:glucose-6-phosphate dehydrogenase assembly protein OpcA
MTATVTPETIEIELADLRGKAAGEQAGVRTHIVDLIAHASTAERADEICGVIAGMRHHRPSRAIVTNGVEGRTSVSADASVFCAPMQEGGRALVCTELVRLDGPPDGDGLPNMAASLLLPDLPVFLLWLAPPEFYGAVFDGLASLATRLVTDSIRQPGTLDHLPELISRGQQVVTDLGWTKITGWRDVVAGVFDDADARRRLSQLERLSIRFVEGSTSQARLLAGWLAASTGTEPTVELDPVPVADMRAGSLVRVEATCGGLAYVIDRPHEGTATITVPGRQVRHAALRVPPFATLVGDELEFLATDHAFLRALAAAPGSGGSMGA